jgi:hypothetical protein
VTVEGFDRPFVHVTGGLLGRVGMGRDPRGNGGATCKTAGIASAAAGGGAVGQFRSTPGRGTAGGPRRRHGRARTASRSRTRRSPSGLIPWRTATASPSPRSAVPPEAAVDGAGLSRFDDSECNEPNSHYRGTRIRTQVRIRSSQYADHPILSIRSRPHTTAA